MSQRNELNTKVVTLISLDDEKYFARLKKAGWRGGVPHEFIDPIFKTIIPNKRFFDWLSMVEDHAEPKRIPAWLDPVGASIADADPDYIPGMIKNSVTLFASSGSHQSLSCSVGSSCLSSRASFSRNTSSENDLRDMVNELLISSGNVDDVSGVVGSCLLSSPRK